MSSPKTCLSKKSHVCSYPGCGKSFGRQSRFLVHSRTHTGEKPFVCDREGCFKSYARAQHLKRHVEISHSVSKPEPNVFKCMLSDCEKEFVNDCNLNRHKQTVHSKQFKYRCSIEGCKKKFSEEHQLKRHELQHETSKPYVCSFEGCGYTCKIGHQLKRHIKTHEGYTCNIDGCNIKFETWSMIRKHKMINHPKEFVCSDCQLRFKKKIQLKRHSLIHSTTEAIFKCDQEGCERAYLDLKNLRAHIKSYHDGQRLPCSYLGCSQTFVNKAKLNHHLKLHDPNKPPPKKMPKKGHRRKGVVHQLKRLIGVMSSDSETDAKKETDALQTVTDSALEDVSAANTITSLALQSSLAETELELEPITVNKEKMSANVLTSHIAMDTFSKNIDCMTSPFLSESASGSIQSPDILNDSLNSNCSQSSLIIEETVYNVSDTKTLPEQVQLDAVDIWLEAMAENVVNSADVKTETNQ